MENSALTPRAMTLAALMLISVSALAQNAPGQIMKPAKPAAPAAMSASAGAPVTTEPAKPAAPPPSPPPALDNQVIDELTKISTENALLKAKLKQLEIQVQIANAQAQLDKARGEDTKPKAGQAQAPVVKAIDGIDLNLYATIVPAGSYPIEVKAGDVLQDGTHVVSVSPKEVVFLMPDKRRLRVGIDRSTAPVGVDVLEALKASRGMSADAGRAGGYASSPYQPSFPSIPLTQRAGKK